MTAERFPVDPTAPSSDGKAARTIQDPGVTAVFVRRPVLAVVVNLLILVAGLAALGGVEVRELPNVDQPVISVRTAYTGASAETMDTQVTGVLEDALAQTPGLQEISSTSSYGDSRITLTFDASADVSDAANDVRDIIARADDLPEEADDPVVSKSDADASPVMRLSLSADGLAFQELTRLAEDRVIDELSAVEGVAQVGLYGDRKEIMRVTLSPVALASRGLTVDDLKTSLSNAALDAPTGALRTETQNLVVRSQALAETAAALSDIYVDETTRVGDVAFVQRTPDEEKSSVRIDGQPSLGIEIIAQAQANTLRISKAVRARVAELQDDLPNGVALRVASDDGVFIEKSINEVAIHLVTATAIVTLVIFLFLGSLRATIIPAVCIPIALIGTIAAIWLAGFSINTLTLLGLVLSTGLVVDDAIIVLENIERRRREGLGRRAAAVLGTREVFFAVIATTATLAAVFVPISFLPGQAGRLFSEFGFTLAFAVLVSSFTALTLCPMLAAKLDVGKPGGRRSLLAIIASWIGRPVDAAYRGMVEVALHAPYAVMAAALVFAALSFGLYKSLPQEITPTEDRGFFFAIVNAPGSASLAYTAEQVGKVEAVLAPYRDTGEINVVQSIVGRGSLSRAFVISRLTDWESGRRNQAEIQGEINRKLQAIPGVRVFARSGNSLGIRGGGRGLTFALTGTDYDALAKVGDRMVQALNATPGFINAEVDFDVNQPQLSVSIDRQRASDLGISLDAVTTTLRTMIAGEVASELFLDDEIVEVKLMPGGRPVDDGTDLENLFIKTGNLTSGDNGDAAFVPLSSIVTITEQAAAPSLTREGRARAVSVQVNLDGIDLGESVERMQEIAERTVNGEARIVLTGEAASLQESGEGVALVFAAAIVIVLLVLAAQFESVVSALVIMLTVPFGIGGAFIAMWISGGSLNIYSQIGLVMLVGIMAKNGILVVEFADQLRDRGLPLVDAIRSAARLRFRPVMMTMAATITGGIPLVMGAGAGAEARTAIGWVVVGGLSIATVFTLFLVPALYVVLARLNKPRAREEELLLDELAAASST
ncbi:efflux RND transporter permease subunit [Rhizobiaceae bacterium]|nr:efflux RND transporter permease subunit [Rhizobiaceae bacterium]